VPRTARGDVAKGDRLTAEIFHFHCSDVADLGSWVPADDADVYLPLEMVIGPRGGGAGDLFQVLVATPRAMQVRRHRGGRPRSGHPLPAPARSPRPRRFRGRPAPEEGSGGLSPSARHGTPADSICRVPSFPAPDSSVAGSGGAPGYNPGRMPKLKPLPVGCLIPCSTLAVTMLFLSQDRDPMEAPIRYAFWALLAALWLLTAFLLLGMFLQARRGDGGRR